MDNYAVILKYCPIGQDFCFDKSIYEIVRNSILKHLLVYGAMNTAELSSLVKNHLRNKFADSMSQYYESIWQDLEVRGEIRLIPKTRPQLVEIVR